MHHVNLQYEIVLAHSIFTHCSDINFYASHGVTLINYYRDILNIRYNSQQIIVI